MMVILFFKGITLSGAWIGIKFLLIPDLKKFLNLDIWISAANQVIFTIGLGEGANISISKYRKKEENLISSSMLMPLFMILFALLCCLVNFSFLGHLSHELNISIEELPIEGANLAFITYPSAIAMLPISNLWAILFFIMIITIGTDSLVSFS